ncbi:MAG: DUF47 family protein [Clostridia bacterium]|nr:DUF47 family protein [Clostridia bacterium]
MANKQDLFFFENLVQAADCSCRAASFLVQSLEEYRIDALPAMLEEIHRFEHEGDLTKHKMNAALAKAFVTPVDREDLALISHNIDEVTDAVEDVLQSFYMNRIHSVLPEALEFVRKIEKQCLMMREMLSEFVNFKKPAKLHKMVVAINDVEEECDRLYIEAKHGVREKCNEVLEVLFWREIFDKMEACADACEHVGDSVDTVVMKNS